MKNVYCEPFCIERGYQFEIHHVGYQENEAYNCLLHFHEVHEFIIFDEIDGSYFYSLGQSQLVDNDIVFTPAMETHDFELSQKAKSWHIIQILPEFFQQKELIHCANLFEHGMHLRLPSDKKAEVNQQVKWLLASYQQDPLSPKSILLLKLLILWIAEHAVPVKKGNAQPLHTSAGYERLVPVINQFRHESFVELTMIEAAAMCHLSPSHFSRLFKKVFRYSFSEYLLRHKLYSAARLLSYRKNTVTDISYNLNFSSPSHFISQFKKLFGITPLQYQKEVFKRGEG